MAHMCQTSTNVAWVCATRTLAKQHHHLPSLMQQEFHGTQVSDLHWCGRGVCDRALAK